MPLIKVGDYFLDCGILSTSYGKNLDFTSYFLYALPNVVLKQQDCRAPFSYNLRYL